MTTAAPPPAPPKGKPAAPPAPPPQAAKQVGASTTTKRDFKVKSGVLAAPMKVGLFGPGGIGKTKLITLAQQLGLRVLLIDLEQGSHYLDVARVDDIYNWEDLRAVVQDHEFLSQFDMIGIDSFTKAEEFSAEWVPQNIKGTKTGKLPEVKSLNAYGFGDGLTFNYDNFLKLLGDLDALVRIGKHVAFTCHDCISEVPNPAGENFIRYEPRLQSPKSGKDSIRLRVREWCDHLLCVRYDVYADENRKGTGSGTRQIYPTELPSHMAKSRTLSEPIPYTDNDPTLWKMLLNKE